MHWRELGSVSLRWTERVRRSGKLAHQWHESSTQFWPPQFDKALNNFKNIEKRESISVPRADLATVCKDVFREETGGTKQRRKAQPELRNEAAATQIGLGDGAQTFPSQGT